MNALFIPVVRCGGWDDPDSAWGSVRGCVRKKKDILSGKNKLADCDKCNTQRYLLDYWACPSCKRVFGHFRTSYGKVNNIQLGEGQIIGNRVYNTRGELHQTDQYTCPYCGFKSKGYDYEPINELKRL